MKKIYQFVDICRRFEPSFTKWENSSVYDISGEITKDIATFISVRASRGMVTLVVLLPSGHLSGVKLRGK
jgi:hypothetical protein